jgi:hypothetical protein
MLPVLKLLELFSKEVIADPIQEKTFILSRSRLLYNMGLKDQGSKLAE